MKTEQKEALVRIPVVIIGQIILDLWSALISVIGLIHLIYVLVTNKRHRGLAKFANYFVTYMYKFVRYAALTTNKRPFPWGEFGSQIEKVDMKKKA